MIQDLCRGIALDLQQTCHAQGLWRWRERAVKLIDGSTLLAADTPSNRQAFPPHGNQKNGLGFPLLRVCALLCLGTGSVCDFEMAPIRGKKTGEQTLARTLLRSLHRGDILLGDALMDSYYFLVDVNRGGADALFEALSQRKVKFPKGRADIEVELTRPYYHEGQPMSREEYQTYPKKLKVRFIKDGKRILVTTLLDSKKHPRSDLQRLYAKRWNAELDLRNIKDVMGVEMVRAQTPEMVKKEIWAKLLAYNLIRLTIAEAATRHGCDPREISFTGAVNTLNIFIPLIQMARGQKKTDLQDRMFQVIASNRVGNRPGRREPRAVKRRPKPFDLLTISRQEWKKRNTS